MKRLIIASMLLGTTALASVGAHAADSTINIDDGFTNIVTVTQSGDPDESSLIIINTVSDGNTVTVNQAAPEGLTDSDVTLSHFSGGGTHSVIQATDLDGTTALSRITGNGAFGASVTVVQTSPNFDTVSSDVTIVDGNGDIVDISQDESSTATSVVNIDGLAFTGGNRVRVDQDTGNTVNSGVGIIGAGNTVEVLQDGFGLFLDSHVAISGNSNTATVTQTGSFDAFSTIDIVGDLNSAQVSQFATFPVSDIDVLGNGNLITVAQFFDGNLSTVLVEGNDNEVDVLQDLFGNNSDVDLLAGSDDNTIWVSQLGTFNISVIALSNSDNNSVHHMQNGSFDLASTAITNAIGNVVNVTQN